jgi:UDP-N-acetylmuramoyl-L-alanyl-D-glutamate--2,6-diaminopimelate ligase
MELSELVGILGEKAGATTSEVEVAGIKNDSRLVKPGDLFVAVRGLESDGHKYIPDALRKGATALVSEDFVEAGVPCVVVKDTRKALPLLAAAFYAHPSKDLRMIGVTGTKGKTTTTSLIRTVLVRSGRRVGLVGTINAIVCDEERPARLTTPESIDLQSLLRQMADCGTSHAVMEASSHALSLHRVDSCEFDIGVFTNLTHEHLDYHLTMDNYRAAKAVLFEGLGRAYWGAPKSGPKAGVINMDDPSGQYMRDACRVPVLTYGINSEADVRAHDISFPGGRCSFTATTPLGRVSMRLLLAGRINVYNSLAAMAVACIEGGPLEMQKEALETRPGPPGRFERVDVGQKFTVVVDYAHSPDSLENTLGVARDLTSGRVIVVFGCGGDRDRTKRPVMGRIAGRLSDLAIITSDNPRSEDPEAIIDEVEAGIRDVPPPLGYQRECDRETAIRTAIWAASPGDVVLIAGKGHEDYQIFRDRTIHFDDREVARKLLSLRRASLPALFEDQERS